MQAHVFQSKEMLIKCCKAEIRPLILITQFVRWRERCSRIFSGTNRTFDQLAQDIKQQLESTNGGRHMVEDIKCSLNQEKTVPISSGTALVQTGTSGGGLGHESEHSLNRLLKANCDCDGKSGVPDWYRSLLVRKG